MLSEIVCADVRDIGMPLGEIAKVHLAVAIGSYTNVVLRGRDAQKLAQAKRAVEDMLERVRRAQSKYEARPLTAKTGVRVP